MGKLYGQTPSDYFEIVDNQSLNVAINYACAAAFWEDENYHYKKSKETAQNEAGAIDQVLEQATKQMNERG
jgi:hypothetical protein